MNGVPWTIIPFPQATNSQQAAEQLSICWRATADVDRICNQPLRATLDVEQDTGPDYRLTVSNSTGVAQLVTSRWPVLQVIGAQVSPAAAFPASWTVLPANAVRSNTTLIGAYGTTAPGTGADGPSRIDIAPGYVDWRLGRNGYLVQVAYLNGWPHAGITGSGVATGGLMIPVDDVTGFAGAAPFIYDGASTEQVSVLSVTAATSVSVMGVSVPVGPGFLNLASGTSFAHSAGVVVSSMTADVQLATILLCAAQALEAGIESVSLADIHGSAVSSGGGVGELQVQAEVILASYRRVV